jgi:hypothetical protein
MPPDKEKGRVTAPTVATAHIRSNSKTKNSTFDSLPQSQNRGGAQ